MKKSLGFLWKSLGKKIGPKKSKNASVKTTVEKEPEPKVVIIGGGLAGLSAAQRLARGGFKKFSVYEAGDSAGGRIKTAYVGDAVAELGAKCMLDGRPELAANKSSNNMHCRHLTSDGRAIDKTISNEALCR